MMTHGFDANERIKADQLNKDWGDIKDLPARREPNVPEKASGNELANVEARAISKFAEASMMEFTAAEKAVLSRPVPVEEILLRPCRAHSETGARIDCNVCQLYLDWGYYANILDEAFGPGAWAISPAPWSPKLYREGNITYREYVLWIRGHFGGSAVGHHEEFRKTANFGDAAEATQANALMRCCKRLGIARDLWRKSKIDEFRKALAARKTAPKPPSAPVTLDAEPVVPPLDRFTKLIQEAKTIPDLSAVWDQIKLGQKVMPPSVFVELTGLKNAKKCELEAKN